MDLICEMYNREMGGSMESQTTSNVTLNMEVIDTELSTTKHTTMDEVMQEHGVSIDIESRFAALEARVRELERLITK
jgi:hypothetical protein